MGRILIPAWARAHPKPPEPTIEPCAKCGGSNLTEDENVERHESGLYRCGDCGWAQFYHDSGICSTNITRDNYRIEHCEKVYQEHTVPMQAWT